MQYAEYVLPGLLSQLAGQAGVELAINTKAKTFGIQDDTVVMPPIPLLQSQATSAAELEDVTIGAALHGAARIRFSEREKLHAWRQTYQHNQEADFINAIGNIFTDAQCQVEMGRNSPAFYRQIAKMQSRLVGRKLSAEPSSEACLAEKTAAFVFAATQHAMLGTSLSEELYKREQEAISEVLPPEQVSRIAGFAQTAHLLSSTEDALRTSQAIVTLLGIVQAQKEDEPQKQPGDGDDEVESGGAPSPFSTASMGEEGNSLADQYDAFAMASQAVEDIAEENPDAPTLQTIEAPGLEGSPDLASEEIKPDPTAGQVLRWDVQTHAMMASARLATLLQAQTYSTSEYARKGKLIAARAWKIKAGNLRVFRQEKEGRAFSTSVHILLDRSGSMSKTMRQALESAVFMPLAISGIDGIETAIDVFPGFSKGTKRLLEYGQRVDTALDDIAGVSANGGTPLLPAINVVGADLADRTSDRKILVLITDGEPDSSTGDVNQCRARLLDLSRSGIEVVGIGIGVNISKMVPQSVNIKSCAELTNALAGVLERSLLMAA